ncbi:PepSY domain-containing protein [Candidatus Arthromitus sp. SFB-rat-Yit]|uniref:PepSY domain-containing protein n=1 Tax=Candidatus Arthromitus sp. SFB-rat-Yit TaxID=1041504 RepID=UPI000227A480|nr:PepSY domain-containing protein [Candidatus Arthromitus sp. SFB-rat-Yit]BAK81540.1 putative peptidase [Candidatus Arthromitus sp. SFB-rat-Yit]
MKKSRVKIVAGVFVAALLVTAGSFVSKKGNVTEVSAVTESSVDNTQLSRTVTNLTTVTTSRLSFDQLKQKALSAIPGTVVKYSYDYDNGTQIIEFEIRDSSGRIREIDLVVATGQVWKIDHDIDANGNRFINQSLFTVNKSFEECQKVALAQFPGGTVLTYKQGTENGKFVHEVIVKAVDGRAYEVDVETQNGTVIKVERNDDYDFYQVPAATPVVQTPVSQQVYQTPQVQQVQQVQTPAVNTPVVQTPNTTNTSGLEGAKNIVRQRFPGCTFLKIDQDWDDGTWEYEFTIRTTDGSVYDVEVKWGTITDLDLEGKVVNGIYYEY